MKSYSNTLVYTLSVTFYWTLLNSTFNIGGLWISKLIEKNAYIYPAHLWLEFTLPMLIQSIGFAICMGLFYHFQQQNLKFAWLTYPTVIFIMLHVFFAACLKTADGIYFETTLDYPPLHWLGYHGQYLTETIFSFWPIEAKFENGIFKPHSTFQLYLQWVLGVAVYFTALSWLTLQMQLFFSTKSIKIESAQ